MANTKKQRITPMEARRLAVAAETDPRTILRVLEGEGGPKAEARERARRALVAAGYLPAGSTP